MRKVSPKTIRKDFLKQLEDLATFHEKGLLAFDSKSDQSTLTEHSLLTAAVIWERFVSKMFIAYINSDATKFKDHLNNSFNEHLKESPKSLQIFKYFGSLAFPTHLTKSEVQSNANSSGNNITFPNFDELEEKASKWLVKKHADKFIKLTAQQKAVVNSVISLRNHIAHRSQRSLAAMNKTLGVGALHQTRIKRLDNRIHKVGAWLKSTPSGCDETRFSIIIRYLKDIGGSF